MQPTISLGYYKFRVKFLKEKRQKQQQQLKFYTYSLQLTMHEALFTQRYGNKTVISKKKEKWVIQNPANPEDNLADSWTDETAKVFFKWTSALKTDLIDSLSEDDDSFRVCIENAFGESVVKCNHYEK